jgi:hypothetical protein
LEQLDDVLDGMVGFVEGRFELAFGQCSSNRLMVKEAVGKGSRRVVCGRG